MKIETAKQIAFCIPVIQQAAGALVFLIGAGRLIADAFRCHSKEIKKAKVLEDLHLMGKGLFIFIPVISSLFFGITLCLNQKKENESLSSTPINQNSEEKKEDVQKNEQEEILENPGLLKDNSSSKKEKITPQPVEVSTIQFSSAKNFMKRGEDFKLKDKPFIKQMKENEFNHPYTQAILNLCNEQFSSETTVETQPTIQIPNISAMKAVAFRYYEKYKIEMYVQTLPELNHFIEEYAETLTESCYIGIITGQHILSSGSHATPLLCYFNKTEKGVSVDVAILDSVINPFYTNCIYQALKPLKIPNTVSIEGSARQADQSSCRTDALITLRNALLWIKQNQINGGFTEIFKKEKSPQSNDPSTSDWIYHAQIYKKQDLDKTNIAVRRVYSKKLSEEKKLETIEENRDRNKKPHKIKYEVAVNWVDEKQLQVFKDLECPKFIIKKQINSSYTFFVFSLNVSLNDYLVRKGLKWHQQYSQLQK